MIIECLCERRDRRGGGAGMTPLTTPLTAPRLLRVHVPSVWRKRMRDGTFLRHHFSRARLAADSALDGLARRLIVELLDLLVVLGLPVNEDADADEQIVGLVR